MVPSTCRNSVSLGSVFSSRQGCPPGGTLGPPPCTPSLLGPRLWGSLPALPSPCGEDRRAGPTCCRPGGNPAASSENTAFYFLLVFSEALCVHSHRSVRPRQPQGGLRRGSPLVFRDNGGDACLGGPGKVPLYRRASERRVCVPSSLCPRRWPRARHDPQGAFA